MSYKAQLVVRSSDRRGVELIERVKALGQERDIGFSAIALELFERALADLEASPSEAEVDATPEAMPLSVAIDTCLDRYDRVGPEAAAEVLAEFYATASPVDGAHLRAALEERLGEERHKPVYKHLERTDAYRRYQRRVVFGS